MKTQTRITAFAMMAFAFLILAASCKKDEEDPIPVFTLSYDTVTLVSGGKGVQFHAQCTNNDVTMAQTTITNPANGTFLQAMNNISYSKNASIPLQDNNSAYIYQTGTWKFNLTGKTSGGLDFAVISTISVAVVK
jgi:hypothetical protein